MGLFNKFFAVVSVVCVALIAYSCREEWDDPIPEGFSLVRSSLLADLTEDGSILLTWGDFRICRGLDCGFTVEASSYDLFLKGPRSQNFERFLRLSKGSNQFLFDNVIRGEVYEFFIRSNRAGTSVDSNTIMIAPERIPDFEQVFQSKGSFHSILHPRLSPTGKHVAYVSDVRFTEQGQELQALSLFMYDVHTQEHRLVRRNVNQPNWSSDGKRLIYSATAGTGQTPQGVWPSHLEIFHLDTEEFSLFSRGLHQQLLPGFSKDNQDVFFLSDSLNSGEFGLWKRDFLGNALPVSTSLRDPDLLAGMSLFHGLDVSRLKEMVAVDFLRLFNNRPVYHIFGFDMARGGQKVDLMVSQWSNSSPSFSSFDADKMAFLSNRSGTPQIWLLDMTSGSLRQLTFFRSNQSDARLVEFGMTISWTDNGETILFPLRRSGGVNELVKLKISP